MSYDDRPSIRDVTDPTVVVTVTPVGSKWQVDTTAVFDAFPAIYPPFDEAERVTLHDTRKDAESWADEAAHLYDEGSDSPYDFAAVEYPDNVARRNGLDRCACGCKYWYADHCADCNGTEVE